MDIRSFMVKWVPIVGMVVLAIVGVLQLCLYLSSAEARAELDAVVTIEGWHAPRNVASDWNILQQARTEFKHYGLDERQELQEDHSQFSTTWSLLERTARTSDFDLNSPCSMCDIEISNHGDAPAKTIILEFPDANYIEVDGVAIPRKNKNPAFRRLRKSLIQGETTKVRIWASCQAKVESAEKITITWEEGRAKTLIRHPNSAFTQAFGQYSICAGAVSLAPLSLMHVLFIARRRRKYAVAASQKQSKKRKK